MVFGGKVSPGLCGRLSAIGVRELEKCSVPELLEMGLTKTQALKLRASFLFTRKCAESTGRLDRIKSPYVRWCERTGASRPLLLDSMALFVFDHRFGYRCERLGVAANFFHRRGDFFNRCRLTL